MAGFRLDNVIAERARLGGFRLGRLLGIPIDVRYSFLVLLLLAFFVYGGLSGAALLLLTFVSVLLHELGHAVVARRLGVEIVNIELHFFGGAARMASMPSRARDEVLIAAAGPAVSFALAAVGGVAYFVSGLRPLAFLAYVNLVLGLFNLLPALPMDGGRIFRALLSAKLGRLRATEVSVKVARGLALAMGIWALFAGQLFLAALAVMLWMMAGAELQAARVWAYAERGGQPFGWSPGLDGAGFGPAAGRPAARSADVEVLDRDGNPVGGAPQDVVGGGGWAESGVAHFVVEQVPGERRWVLRGPDGQIIVTTTRPMYF